MHEWYDFCKLFQEYLDRRQTQGQWAKARSEGVYEDSPCVGVCDGLGPRRSSLEGSRRGGLQLGSTQKPRDRL